MPTPTEIFKGLLNPFPVEQVSWRAGKKSGGKALMFAYIDARDVMQRLDEVVGAENWEDDYKELGKTMICRLGLRLRGDLIWKADGAGETGIEAEKGQVSDCFKRAAVKWGVGRYLYNIKAVWVDVDAYDQPTPAAQEYLYSLLPNNVGGLTQHTLEGQSKEPAKFWSKGNLSIFPKLSKDHKDAHGDPLWGDPECIALLCADIHKAINKAPTKDLLVKLQVDNIVWLQNRLPGPDSKAIMDAFTVRAVQFDQLVKE